MAETVLVIKTDGMPYRDAIWDMVSTGGLKVVVSRRLLIPRSFHELLYPRGNHEGQPDAAWMRAMELQTSKESEVAVLRGHNAVERLLEIAGRKTSPMECVRGTIRREFGVGGVETFGEFALFRKIVHRPETIQEALHDLPIIRALIRWKLLGI